MRLTNTEVLRAQNGLAKLMEIDLPIKVSLDIALISKMVDDRVVAFGKVRDILFKKYSIRTEKGESEGQVKFTCTSEAETEEATAKLRQDNLVTVLGKFDELLEANAEEFSFKKIQLPKEVDGKPLQVKSEILKDLTEFVEV